MNTTTISTPGLENKQSVSAAWGVIKHSLIRTFPSISEWKKRVLYRRDLRRLFHTGRHLVQDIGLDIDEALFEITKPFYIK